MDDQGTDAEVTTSAVDVDLTPAWAATPPSHRKRILVRSLLGLVVAGLVAVWAFAFYKGSQPLPDRMDDPVVSAQAEQICSVAVAANKALPPAYEMDSAAQRADVLDESDVTLTAMVDQLDQLQPTTPRDVDMWDKWVADWRTYLSDRSGYVQRLRADPNARFYVTEKDKDQVTEPIDRFARSNRMLSCATPRDLG